MRKRARSRKVRYAVLYTAGTLAISPFQLRKRLEQVFVISQLQKNTFTHISFWQEVLVVNGSRICATYNFPVYGRCIVSVRDIITPATNAVRKYLIAGHI